jgi:thiol:disulfide interchange protein
MAAIVVIAALACASPDSSRAASGVQWEKSFEAALQRAGKEKKLVMVFFYTDWCGWCRRMDQNTFADARVQAELSRLVPVRLNAEGNGRAEAARFRVNSFPVIAFLDATGRQVARIPGFLPPPAFLEELGDVLKESASK